MEKRFISLLSRLVEINTINSTLSNGPGEGELADFILNYLSKLNIGAEIQTIAPAKANVVAVIPGSLRLVQNPGIEFMDLLFLWGYYIEIEVLSIVKTDY